MADNETTDLGTPDSAQTDTAAQSSPATQQPPQNDLADLTPVTGSEKSLAGAHPVAANDLTPVDGTEKSLSLPKEQKVQASGILTGPVGGTTIGPREHSFHNWLQDVQADVKSGSSSTWVGAMLKKFGAPGTDVGYGHIVGDDYSTNTAGDFMAGPLQGVPKALEGATEVATELGHGVTDSNMDYGKTVRGVNKAIAGTFQSLGPLAVTQPEALAVIVPAMVAQSQATKAAKYMGADDDTAELVGNVGALFAANKVHASLHPTIERFGVAVNNRTAAEQEYNARSRELETARGQSAEMSQRAIDAAGKETSGQGTPADTDAARTAASEAAKNVANAQKAFDQSSQRRDASTIEVEKLARKIQTSADKTTAAEYEARASEQKKAKDFFQKAVPSRGSNRYTDEDYDVARAHMEAAKANGAKITDLPSAYEAVEDARQGIESKLDPYIEKYKDEPLTSNPEDSPKVKVAAKLAEMAKVDGNFDNAMDALSDFNITDPTVGEAKDMLTKLNNYQRAAMKGANNWDIYNMIETRPDFAARYFMADELRNGLHDNLEGHGVEGSRAARGETKSLVNVRDAIGAQIRANRGGTAVRGSGTQSMTRLLVGKLTGKAIKGAGIAAGAEMGGIPGAVAGGAVGEMVGQPVEDFLAPRDMTRDQHIEKSMKYKGTNRKPVEIKGEGTPANIPNESIPPAPKDMGPSAVELTPRENTELHAELAAHYGQSNLEDASYSELEQQLREDVAAKTRNNVALDPAEKTLLTKILKADSTDRATTQAAGKPGTEVKIAPEIEKVLVDEADQRAESGEPTKLNPHLVSIGRGDESALVSHSPAMKAHAPAEPINAASGITSDMAHRHEWAHMAINAVDSQKPSGVGILASTHPEAAGGATSLFNMEHLFGEGGQLDPESLKAEETTLLTQKLAGPASHEVFDGMTKDEAMSHSGTRTDVRQARQLVRDVHPEFSAGQVEEVVDAAYERARDFLTKPHIADRIKANAAVREVGLNKDYHASRGRISQFQDDIRKAHEENGNEPQSSGGGAGEGGEKAEEPATEEGKKNAGGNEGRGKPESPRSSRKPQATRGDAEVKELSVEHRENAIGGDVRLGKNGENGYLAYSTDGKDAAVRTAMIDSTERGKGYGQKMYEEAANKLREKGVENFHSDPEETSADANRVWEKLSEKHPNEITKDESGRYTWNLKASDIGKSQIDKAAKGLVERTTGSPETDEAIKQGGGVPAGVLGDLKGDHVKMFHDPTTGTTLGFAGKEPVTAEATKSKLEASRAQYAAAETKNNLEQSNVAADRVSTRVPEGKDSTENPLEGEPLVVGREALKNTPAKLQQKFADTVRDYPGVKIPDGIKDPQKVMDRFVSHVKDNLKFLYDQVEPDKQVANAKWYESANKLSKDLADKHGISEPQAAATIATQSPQKDWDMNVSLARRIADIHANHQDTVTTPEMLQKGHDIVAKTGANKDLDSVINKLEGKKFSDLTDPFERAAWVRLYDEAHNTRDFHYIDPGTGENKGLRTNADGSPSKVAWGTLPQIDNALSVLNDGSRANISERLGGMHKVRNFYNNIIDPTNDQDVTIDTHAVAAGLMQPLGGNAPEVLDNFGKAGKHTGTGVKGTYPLYADAYRQAASELNIKPRELQSVVWEHVRNMFPSEWKSPENEKLVKGIWKKYSDGKQSLNATRQQILAVSEAAQKGVNEAREAAQKKSLDKQAKVVHTGEESGGAE